MRGVTRNFPLVHGENYTLAAPFENETYNPRSDRGIDRIDERRKGRPRYRGITFTVNSVPLIFNLDNSPLNELE